VSSGGILRLLAAVARGLVAGANLTEGAVLVPYWRSAPPAEFLAWYGANDERLLEFFGPLGAVAVVLSVVAALTSSFQRHPGRALSWIAALTTTAAAAMFFLYFRAANASFSDGSIGVERLPAELARWAAWHGVRTGLTIVAFGTSLLAMTARRRR
jgi:hypothetical protein